MLKRLLSAALMAVALAIAVPALEGCTGQNSLISQVSGPRATVGKAVAGITTVRDMLNAALNGNLIKADDGEDIRTQLGVLRKSADVADTMVKSGAVGADAKIAALQASIDLLRDYLIKQGVKAS